MVMDIEDPTYRPTAYLVPPFSSAMIYWMEGSTSFLVKRAFPTRATDADNGDPIAFSVSDISIAA
jgi:hypothetical protein